MPKFKAGSNAEARRFRVVNFPNTFEGAMRDTGLKRKLEGEKEGILRMLIDRLAKVIRLTELPYGSKISRTMYRDFKVSNDPTKAFVDECLVLNQSYGDYLTRDDIFKAFCIYAELYNMNRQDIDKGATFKKIYRYAPMMQANDVDRKLIEGKQRRIVRKVKFSEKGVELVSGWL
jgi:phage/plasmid-associated DNA primase